MLNCIVIGKKKKKRQNATIKVRKNMWFVFTVKPQT